MEAIVWPYGFVLNQSMQMKEGDLVMIPLLNICITDSKLARFSVWIISLIHLTCYYDYGKSILY